MAYEARDDVYDVILSIPSGRLDLLDEKSVPQQQFPALFDYRADLLPLDLEERSPGIVDIGIERVYLQPHLVIEEKGSLEGDDRDAVLREIEGFHDGREHIHDTTIHLCDGHFKEKRE